MPGRFGILGESILNEQPVELTIEQEFHLIGFTKTVNASTEKDLPDLKGLLIDLYRQNLALKGLFAKMAGREPDIFFPPLKELP